MFTYYIPPKCAKTREHKDECCVLQCTYVKDNIHEPIPLEKLKNHTALPYITIKPLRNRMEAIQKLQPPLQ